MSKPWFYESSRRPFASKSPLRRHSNQVRRSRLKETGQKTLRTFTEDLLITYILYTGGLQYLSDTLKDILEEITEDQRLVLTPIDPEAQLLSGFEVSVPVEVAQENRDYYLQNVIDSITEV